MKFSFATLAALSLLSFSACRNEYYPQTKKIHLQNGIDLELETKRATPPGRFFLGLADMGQVGRFPFKSSLAVVDSGANVLFQRTFAHYYQDFAPADFRPVENNLYGYFLGAEVPWAPWFWSGTYHFLDGNFSDVFPRAVPNDDHELDSHDVLVGPNGNYFFIFYRFSARDRQISAEIRELDRNGNTVFSWNSRDHLPPAENSDQLDSFHLNSLDFDSDGGLLLSFKKTNEIVKIAYPSGKILFRISAKDWTFQDDPLNGFIGQHCVRRLENSHLLFFDNGGKERLPRVVEYEIHPDKKIARLVWEFRALPYVNSRERGGSAQRLSNGDTLIGWGYSMHSGSKTPLFQPYPVCTEVSSSGAVVRELRAIGPKASYKCYFQEGSAF